LFIEQEPEHFGRHAEFARMAIAARHAADE
jgi:hypothetical protein